MVAEKAGGRFRLDAALKHGMEIRNRRLPTNANKAFESLPWRSTDQKHTWEQSKNGEHSKPWKSFSVHRNALVLVFAVSCGDLGD